MLSDHEKEEGGNIDMIYSESIFFNSQEDFPDEQPTYIGNTVVSNFKTENVTLASNVKVPEGMFDNNSKFSAKPCSLNNRLVFIATSNYETPHREEKRMCSKA